MLSRCSDGGALFTYQLVRKKLGNLGACPQKNCIKSFSLERHKMPFCVVGKHVFIIDLHSGIENMTSPFILCCTNLKNSTIWFVKKKSLSERFYPGKCENDGKNVLSQILGLQKGCTPLPGYYLSAAAYLNRASCFDPLVNGPFSHWYIHT